MIQSDTGASLHDQSQQALLAAINHIQSHLQDLVSAVVQGSSDPNRHRSRQSSLSLHSAAEYGNYYTGGSRTGSSISLVDTESTPLSPPPASGNDLSSSSRLEQRLDISQDLSLLVSALERIHITLSSPQFVGSVDGSEDNNNDDYHSRRSDATGQDAHRFDNTMTIHGPKFSHDYNT
ncbi:hypothetical protein EV182_001487 [Spiromyces aspiralis]|uniref:Uncharacterized protein n=1 Tax=Spiromyces aspiralis TaxID=68401 RepID=A0ACC1HJ32_9FUNG|nr:hypothetical protein EV182_001487 [Spiromyces aspiralis]